MSSSSAAAASQRRPAGISASQRRPAGISASQRRPDVAFLFLGGLPVPKTDAGRAWKNWLMYASQHHPEYFDRIAIVTHPISADDEIVRDVMESGGAFYWSKFCNPRTGAIAFASVTRDQHHLRTAWATRSLVDATILMMRLAQNIAGGAARKFILVDKTSCPLYNLKVIYNAVLSNDLNWFDQPIHNRCARLLQLHSAGEPSLQCNRHDPKACLRKTDCSFWSQWWVIDARFYPEIFEVDLIKSEKPVTCGNHDGKVIDTVKVSSKGTAAAAPLRASSRLADRVIDAALAAFTDPVNRLPCGPSDELFFQMLLKRKYDTPAEFFKTMNMLSLDEYYTSAEQLPEDLRLIDVPLRVMPMDTIYTKDRYAEAGSVSGALPFIEQFFGYSKRSTEIVVAGGPKSAAAEPGWEKLKFRETADAAAPETEWEYQAQWSNKLGKFPFYANEVHILDKPVSPGALPIPSTYTDWRYANLNPYNVFRSYQHEGYVFTEISSSSSKFKNISLYSPWELIDQVLGLHCGGGGEKETSTGGGGALLQLPIAPASFESTLMSHIPYYSHPLEYDSTNVFLLMNAHNLLEFYCAVNRHFGEPDGTFENLRDRYADVLQSLGSDVASSVECSRREENQQQQQQDDKKPAPTSSLAEDFAFSLGLLFGILPKKGEGNNSTVVLRCKCFLPPPPSGGDEKSAAAGAAAIKKIGKVIDAEILMGARMRGALFIRKCGPGSYIHAYSKQLFSGSTYAYAKQLLMQQRQNQ